MRSVTLANGDDVGVPEPWSLPDPLANITTSDLYAAQEAVAAGGPWRENSQAADWVGKPIATVLKLDPDSKSDRQKITDLLKLWIARGFFKRGMQYDRKRRADKPCIEVGEWVSEW